MEGQYQVLHYDNFNALHASGNSSHSALCRPVKLMGKAVLRCTNLLLIFPKLIAMKRPLTPPDRQALLTRIPAVSLAKLFAEGSPTVDGACRHRDQLRHWAPAAGLGSSYGLMEFISIAQHLRLELSATKIGRILRSTAKSWCFSASNRR